MLKYKWTALRSMTLETGFVLAQEQSPTAFDLLRQARPTAFDRAADMRIVTI